MWVFYRDFNGLIVTDYGVMSKFPIARDLRGKGHTDTGSMYFALFPFHYKSVLVDTSLVSWKIFSKLRNPDKQS